MRMRRPWFAMLLAAVLQYAGVRAGPCLFDPTILRSCPLKMPNTIDCKELASVRDSCPPGYQMYLFTPSTEGGDWYRVDNCKTTIDRSVTMFPHYLHVESLICVKEKPSEPVTGLIPAAPPTVHPPTLKTESPCRTCPKIPEVADKDFFLSDRTSEVIGECKQLQCRHNKWAIKNSGDTRYRYYAGEITCGGDARFKDDDGKVVQEARCIQRMMCHDEDSMRINIACDDVQGCEQVKLPTTRYGNENDSTKLTCPTSSKKILIKHDGESVWDELASIHCNTTVAKWEITLPDGSTQLRDHRNTVICADDNPNGRPNTLARIVAKSEEWKAQSSAIIVVAIVAICGLAFGLALIYRRVRKKTELEKPGVTLKDSSSAFVTTTWTSASSTKSSAKSSLKSSSGGQSSKSLKTAKTKTKSGGKTAKTDSKESGGPKTATDVDGTYANVTSFLDRRSDTEGARSSNNGSSVEMP